MYIVIMNNADVTSPENLSAGMQHAAAVIIKVTHNGEIDVQKNNFAKMFEAVHEKRLTHTSWLLGGSNEVERSTSFRALNDGFIECKMTVWAPVGGRSDGKREEFILLGTGDTDEMAFQDCITKLKSWFF